MEEKEWIERCKLGDKKALSWLYTRFSPRMLSICRRYFRAEAEAEDVLQEAFIKIFTKIDSYRYEAPIEKWIERVVINTAINHWKKNRKHYDFQSLEGSLAVSDDEEDQAVELASHLPMATLYEAIRSLPHKYRYVFNLYAIEGYSHREIAERMDIQESTSRSQYTRAKKKVDQDFKEI